MFDIPLKFQYFLAQWWKDWHRNCGEVSGCRKHCLAVCQVQWWTVTLVRQYSEPSLDLWVLIRSFSAQVIHVHSFVDQLHPKFLTEIFSKMVQLIHKCLWYFKSLLDVCLKMSSAIFLQTYCYFTKNDCLSNNILDRNVHTKRHESLIYANTQTVN